MSRAAEAQRCWASFATAAEPLHENWSRYLEDPERVQEQRLTALLQENADTEFGHTYGFERIRSLSEYQSRVPIQTWGDVAPWVERTMRESKSPLTRETPLFFERTSGSSAARKHIPYTAGLLADFQRALVAWLFELYRSCPAVGDGRSYWALSPAGEPAGVAPNGLPVGGASDAVYVQGSAAEPLLGTVLVPAGVADAGTGVADAAAWRRSTLIAITEAPDLAFLSLWSPTFLTALLQPLLDPSNPDHLPTLDALRAALPPHRMSSLERSLADEHFGSLWPGLAAISVWMDGPSASSAAQLRRWFPQTTWCAKGLLATEGVVSFSWGISGQNVLAIDSHVLEFVDDHGALRTTSQLQRGARYRPLISTSGGLYRYRLGDVVEVSGRVGATPCVRFVGREDARCDMVGEKLDESLVSAALTQVLGQASGAYLLPVLDVTPQRYLAVVPSTCSVPLEHVRTRLESQLQQIFHYGHARRLGQLAPVESCAVGDPATLLQLSWESTGSRAGDAKPRALVTSLPQARAILQALRKQAGPAERIRQVS